MLCNLSLNVNPISFYQVGDGDSISVQRAAASLMPCDSAQARCLAPSVRLQVMKIAVAPTVMVLELAMYHKVSC